MIIVLMLISWNSCTLIVAPSNSGKTVLASQIVLDRNRVFNVVSKVCLWFYDTLESVPDCLKGRQDVILCEGLPNLKLLKEYKDMKPLIVIDDQMTKMDKNKDCERLVSVLTHHYDMSVIFVLHSLFYSKTVRMLRLNATYIILFRNNGDKLSIKCLGSQLFPGSTRAFVDIYEDITSKPYQYLLIDLHKHCPDKFRLRDNILPNVTTKVYQPT